MIVEGNAEKGRILLAHGAGAPMDSPFMDLLASKLAAGGVEVVPRAWRYAIDLPRCAFGPLPVVR